MQITNCQGVSIKVSTSYFVNLILCQSFHCAIWHKDVFCVSSFIYLNIDLSFGSVSLHARRVNFAMAVVEANYSETFMTPT
jgi:hypothetical protein